MGFEKELLKLFSGDTAGKFKVLSLLRKYSVSEALEEFTGTVDDVKDAVHEIKKDVEDIVDDAKDIVEDVVDGVSDIVDEIVDFVEDTVETITDAFDGDDDKK